MNQFDKYKEQLKGISEVWKTANDFDYILNNIWCTYSFDKGKTKWREISSKIPESFGEKISTEIYHVESGHGIDQARMAVKHEMEKYIDYLMALKL